MFGKGLEQQGVHRSHWLSTTTNRSRNDELPSTIPVGAGIGRWLGCLNSWQAANVALFSYGIIRAESCQQETVARQVS